MSDLVVITFQGRDTADRVLNDLRSMQREYLVDLEDAAIVTRNEDGKLHLKQSVNLVGMGAMSGGTWGALWGVLVGILFMNPLAGLLAGAAAGAGAGALAGALSDYGINDDFIKQLGETVCANSSALFVLFRKVTLDKVLPEFEKFSGTVMKTSLTQEQEDKLREALSRHGAAA
jgi:Predicted membrane protein